MTITAEMHDGRKLEFPDGTDPSVIQATVKKLLSGTSGSQEQQRPEGLYDASTLGGAAVNLAGAALEPIAQLVSGAAAAPIAGISGLIALITNKFGLTETDAATVVRSVQDALTFKPQTEGGRLGSEYGVPGILGKIGELAYGAGDQVLDATGSPVLATATNTALQAIPAALGAKAGGSLRAVPKTPSAIATEVRSGIAGAIEKHVDPHLVGGVERAGTRIATAVAGERAPAVAAALENPAQNPLNIPQHAGEIAAKAGSTEFSALVKHLSQHKASDFAELEISAADARISAIRKVGKTPEELTAAIKERQTKSTIAYAEAGKDIIRNDAGLQDILDIVPIKAIREASELAKLKREPFNVGTMDGKPTEYPVQTLHYIKLGLDKLIKNPEQYGIGGARRAALIELKNSLVEKIDSGSQKYADARASYAADSKIINQMEIGQALESKLKGILEKENPAAFAAAVKESAGLIKKSTGDARYESLSEVLNTEQMQIVDALVENLSNKASFEKQAQQGAFSAGERLTKAIPYIPAPGILSPPISAGRGIINRMSAKSTDKTLHYLAEIFRNPTQENVSLVFKKATPQERAVIKSVLKLRNQAVVGGSVAAGEQQQEQR